MRNRITLAICFLVLGVVSATQIRCYSGLKYVVGQDVYQDTEDCDSVLGIGDAYCYKFMEETAVNEVVKMGCSSFFCNGIRNRCMQTDMIGMKGTICCCNDRHYCNSARGKITVFLVLFIIFFVSCFQVILCEP
ncbi:unnamed protein product [Caenorhabditis auriculariae]|uniref:UPAR/Ly6 domain-containing protein n=1 Tax=Caenorhabditis auriculariae TaxID=2777116 RepID=A0A8S1H683_9PELO|nr:unnamed protein product [Caenorhabditis auriculariae]